MKHFKDFGKPYVKLKGTKVKIKDILGKPIVITNGKISKSKFANSTSSTCLTLEFKFENDDTDHVLFTGSSVLASQFEIYHQHIPFISTIVEFEGCYTLT